MTITTVGYGDLYPQTALGQAISALVMLLGYAIIAVPSSIFAVELYNARSRKPSASRICTSCSCSMHDADAQYCKSCGATLKA